MKSSHVLTIILFFTSFLITPSCQKADEHSKQPNSSVSQLTDDELVNSIKNDPDWKIIATNNSIVIEKFIAKNIDMSHFDFTNEEAFLKVVDMDKITYLNEVIKNKNAANRLVIKYNFSTKSNISNCPSCNSTSVSSIKRTSDMISAFQSNPELLKRFRERSLGLIAGGTSTNVAKPCCPVAFYGCITVCAATIAAFPVYLICCGGCYLGTCCGG